MRKYKKRIKSTFNLKPLGDDDDFYTKWGQKSQEKIDE